MWRSWYLYIYAFRFLENGYMNPTSIGATWVSNFWRPTTPSPNSLTPRIVVKGAIFLSKFRFFKKACDLWSSDKPKVDLRTKSPRFKHGNHFFLQNNILFYPANSSTLCGFLGLIHWPIRSCQKENPKPSTNYHRPDVEKDLIFGKNPLMIRPPNFHRNHG